MSEPAFLFGRDVLLCCCRAECGIGDGVLLLVQKKGKVSDVAVTLENLRGNPGCMFCRKYDRDHPVFPFVAPSVDMYCEGLHQGY